MRLPVLMLVAVAASAQTPIERIRANVVKFEAQAQDFVCHERITSLTIREQGGEVEKETVVESSFSGRQKAATFGRSFIEDRHIETVNAAPWKDKELPKGIFRIGGGYTSILSVVFGPKSKATYAVEDGAVTFHLKESVKTAHGIKSEQVEGRAWFDPATFEVTKIEESLADGVSIMVEYLPVRIGDATYRMPSKVSAVAHKPGARGEYQAEYTDYRKYGSTSSVEFH